MTSSYFLKILRGEGERRYWETFELELKPSSNIISVLMEIQRHPIAQGGKRVTPVVFEAGCLEEVCGSCSMLINGKPRQACSALVEELLKNAPDRTLSLAPLSKFPLVRDLIVDRSRMFAGLKKIKGWIDVEESFAHNEAGPKIFPEAQKIMYALSTCMSCGCCLEACPQVNPRSSFIGPAAISQARLFNANPIGRMQRRERLRPLMEEGGIIDCGNSQNCVKVCPKNIPLTDSIASVARDVSLQALRDLFSFPDREN